MATVVYIKERRQHLSAMISVMRYCVQDRKTWDDLSQQKLISGINCDGGNSITEFLATKTAYGLRQNRRHQLLSVRAVFSSPRKHHTTAGT